MSRVPYWCQYLGVADQPWWHARGTHLEAIAAPLSAAEASDARRIAERQARDDRWDSQTEIGNLEPKEIRHLLRSFGIASDALTTLVWAADGGAAQVPFEDFVGTYDD